jgi:hypothetical protein
MRIACVVLLFASRRLLSAAEPTPEEAKAALARDQVPARDGRPPGRVRLGLERGWDIWRQRRHKGDITIIDDDVTPAALRSRN